MEATRWTISEGSNYWKVEKGLLTSHSRTKIKHRKWKRVSNKKARTNHSWTQYQIWKSWTTLSITNSMVLKWASKDGWGNWKKGENYSRAWKSKRPREFINWN